VFQFQFGTIDSEIRAFPSPLNRRFNSSLVRLIEKFCDEVNKAFDAFQFQFGTIDSLLNLAFKVCNPMFQFQFGTIDSDASLACAGCLSFVSIPVWYD